MAPDCATRYRARNPRATPLYRLVEVHFDEVKGQWAERFERRCGFWRRFIDEQVLRYIVDRVKDMINRGGFNVYPRDLEEVLMTHPAVSLAAVIGVQDDQHGEEVKAFLVLAEGQTASPEEIVDWSRERMAAFKYPRVVEIRHALPLTATGKILKRELQDQS